MNIKTTVGKTSNNVFECTTPVGLFKLPLSDFMTSTGICPRGCIATSSLCLSVDYFPVDGVSERCGQLHTTDFLEVAPGKLLDNLVNSLHALFTNYTTTVTEQDKVYKGERFQAHLSYKGRLIFTVTVETELD